MMYFIMFEISKEMIWHHFHRISTQQIFSYMYSVSQFFKSILGVSTI